MILLIAASPSWRIPGRSEGRSYNLANAVFAVAVYLEYRSLQQRAPVLRNWKHHCRNRRKPRYPVLTRPERNLRFDGGLVSAPIGSSQNHGLFLLRD